MVHLNARKKTTNRVGQKEEKRVRKNDVDREEIKVHCRRTVHFEDGIRNKRQ